MNFNEAFKLMRDGEKIRNKEWPEDMYLYTENVIHSLQTDIFFHCYKRDINLKDCNNLIKFFSKFNIFNWEVINDNKEEISFEKAIKALKSGHKIKRKKWGECSSYIKMTKNENGKPNFGLYVNNGSLLCQWNISGEDICANDYIIMKNERGVIKNVF